MEADWEFEIASDAPVIDGAWSGFIDLRLSPERARELVETGQLPELAPALMRLNAADTPVWTAKCDVWRPGEIDPDEFSASSEDAACASASYLDLLPASQETWQTLDSAADWCRGVCAALRARSLRHCRADLVIRSAFLTAEQASLGITVYLAGCGPSEYAAASALGTALDAFVDTVLAH